MKEEEILIVDLVLLSEYDISINEMLAILKIHREDDLKFDDTGVDYSILQDKKFIKIIKSTDEVAYILRQRAIDFIEIVEKGSLKVMIKRKTKKAVNVDLLTRLPEFRAQWKGLKVGSMGSLPSCKDKLIRWMDENPEYSFDDIIKAAEIYIDSLHGDYRFLQRADYFIYKQENNREESSRLSAFIDEIKLTGSDVGDWTTKLN